MQRRASLEVARMTERQLWTTAMLLLDRLDFAHPSYDVGHLSAAAFDLRDVLLELRQRQAQLSLLPTPR